MEGLRCGGRKHQYRQQLSLPIRSNHLRLLLRRTRETITGKSQTRCLGARPPASVESAFDSVSSPVQFDEYVKKGGDGAILHVRMSIVILVQQGYRERPFMQFE